MHRSYLLLLLGGIVAGGAFVFVSGAAKHMDPFSGVLLFLLWVESPFLLLAFNVFLVRRYLLPLSDGRLFHRGILLFLGSGVLIYGRAFSHLSEHAMDRTLVFLWGPFYHFAVVAAVTVGFMVRGLQAALRGKTGRP